MLDFTRICVSAKGYRKSANDKSRQLKEKVKKIIILWWRMPIVTNKVHYVIEWYKNTIKLTVRSII